MKSTARWKYMYPLFFLINLCSSITSVFRYIYDFLVILIVFYFFHAFFERKYVDKRCVNNQIFLQHVYKLQKKKKMKKKIEHRPGQYLTRWLAWDFVVRLTHDRNFMWKKIRNIHTNRYKKSFVNLVPSEPFLSTCNS